jgi:hypothetical protein
MTVAATNAKVAEDKRVMINCLLAKVYEESDPPTFIFTLPTGRLATIIRCPPAIWSSIHIGESLRSRKSLHGERRQLQGFTAMTASKPHTDGRTAVQW